MRLFAPERPRLANGRPTYLNRFAIPIIEIHLAEGDRRLAVMLATGPTSFAWFENHFAPNLEEILSRWEEDPEWAMEAYFGWTPPVLQTLKRRASLDALEIEL